MYCVPALSFGPDFLRKPGPPGLKTGQGPADLGPPGLNIEKSPARPGPSGPKKARPGPPGLQIDKSPARRPKFFKKSPSFKIFEKSPQKSPKFGKISLGSVKTPKINSNFDDCGEKVGKNGRK